jgi:hypothetical protein
MYDRPTTAELLEAVRTHLINEVIPSLKAKDEKLVAQTTIAANVLAIVTREMQFEAEHLRAEWMRLNFVQNTTPPPPMPTDVKDIRQALAERNRKLCEEITSGRYDYQPQRAALFEHLLVTARTQLEVANPQFLEALALEDERNEIK